jgi:hypothetical protein
LLLLLQMSSMWSDHVILSLKIRPKCLWYRTCLILTFFRIRGGWGPISKSSAKWQSFTQSIYISWGSSGFNYLCLHTVGLVRMEVVWVCISALFFISEFHFLFLLIFILFWLACIYVCCWCFPLGVYFNVCLFAYLFRLYSH